MGKLFAQDQHSIYSSSFRERTMAVTVAASNALQAIKDGADYLCDGTADEVQINAAIAVGAGSVILSTGTFYIADAIDMLDNSTMRGQGESTILKRVSKGGDGYGIVSVSQVGNVLLQDFVIDGNRASLGDHVSPYGDFDMNLRISRSSNIIAERITAKNSVGQGIMIIASDNLGGESGEKIRVLNCKAIDNNVRGLYIQGILNDILFDGCFVEGNDYGGILIGMNASNDIVVSNCFFRNNGDVNGGMGGTRPEIEMESVDEGISSGVGSAGRCFRRSFINNTVIRDEAMANYTTSGIMMLLVSAYSKDIIISGNYFINNVVGIQYGINITGPVSNMKFINNEYISNNTQHDAYPLLLKIAAASSAWQATTAYRNMNTVIPIAGANGFRYIANVTDVDNRTSGGSEPSWPLYEGGTVVDADITWEAIEDKGVYNSVFANNHFFCDNWIVGIQQGKHKNVQFINNVFSHKSHGAFYFSAATNPSSHFLIEGNIFIHRDASDSDRYTLNDADTETDYCIVKNNFWTSDLGFENLGAGVGGGGESNVVSDNVQN